MLYDKYILWVGLVPMLIQYSWAISKFKFNNIKCEDHDINFSSFEKCKLSVVGRGVVSLNLRVGLYKTPVTNSTINVALYKRASGYRPFLYNVSQDVCAFFANRSRYPILKVMFSVFLQHSNLNHTCPYYDAIVVKDLIMEEDMFRLIPLPDGQYLFKMKVFAYNDLKATVQVHFTCSE